MQMSPLLPQNTFHAFEQGVLILPSTFAQCWHYWQCWLPSYHLIQDLASFQEGCHRTIP